MEIDKPSWNAKITCPDCGQGLPVFYCCPVCGFLTLRCEETGDTFIDPKHLSKGFTKFCPTCKFLTEEFNLADSHQIIKAGFDESQYE